jgi:SAM-dependent methyltransferase
MRVVTSAIHSLGRAYVNRVCEREYQAQSFQCVNERLIEYRFVFNCLSRWSARDVLDVGTGLSALPHLLRTCGFMVTAIDDVHKYWPDGTFVNRHFHVIQDDICNANVGRGKYDWVTCISVLEHVVDHRAAMRAMFDALRPGGHLIVTFPYNERQYVENAYKLPDAGYGQEEPYICRVYSRRELDDWIKDSDGHIVAQEYWEVFTGSLWSCGERLSRPVRVQREAKHHLSCVLLGRDEPSRATAVVFAPNETASGDS